MQRRSDQSSPSQSLQELLLALDAVSAFNPSSPALSARAGKRALPVMTATLKRPGVSKETKRPQDALGLNRGAQEATSAKGNVKIYKGREIPTPAGGLRVGTRQVVVITGASSGLGLNSMKKLCEDGYFVVAAVRDPQKMHAVAKEMGISRDNYVAMYLELASLQSVKDFVDNLRIWLPMRSINHLICNAAVYRPTDPKPAWTDDGFEMSMGINHLGHFLLVQLLLPDLKRAKNARCCIVGSVTGNSNTIAGSFVKPVADLGALKGLQAGGDKASAMVSSAAETFDGAKAYKDAKALNMITALEMHRRYHKDTGVVFNSLYPGCICDTELFREKLTWFRVAWPKLMKLIGSYVTEKEAGQRLAQVISDPNCDKSGVYWSWNGNAQQFAFNPSKTGAGGAGGEAFENEFSDMIKDQKNGERAFEYSMEAVKDYL